MTLLEKIKVNLNYLFGKADANLYADEYNSQNLSLKDWQKRWEIFSAYDCFTWYGVDSEGSLAEFQAAETYIPEIFFQDLSANKILDLFFNNLPDITTGKIPENLREEIKPSSEKVKLWTKESNTGLFIFEDPQDIYWFQNNKAENNKYRKTPYELKSIPSEPLNFSKLPNQIQELLKPYKFENLRFADCQLLDVSKHFYCEE